MDERQYANTIEATMMRPHYLQARRAEVRRVNAQRLRAQRPRPQHFEAQRDRAEQAEANRLSSSLAGLAAAILIVVLGLVLVHHLYDEGRVEDCLMAGRNNCDQMVHAD